MGNILNFNVIFLVLLLLVPGLISQSVFNGLILRGKDKQLDIHLCFLHFSSRFSFILSPNCFVCWC